MLALALGQFLIVKYTERDKCDVPTRNTPVVNDFGTLQ